MDGCPLWCGFSLEKYTTTHRINWNFLASRRSAVNRPIDPVQLNPKAMMPIWETDGLLANMSCFR
jgi:hypothetical protein